jgi:hypothetical protein
MNREELVKFLEDEPENYSSYSSLWKYLPIVDKIRNVFSSIYDYYNIDFKGKTVLDIGPGDGSSLDIAKERGAKECHFIDRDAIITRWCEIKGYTKQFFDYQCVLGIERGLAMPERYDLVIARGSFNADRWNRNEFNVNPDKVSEWVTKIGEHVIFIPTWDRGEAVDGNYHCCYGEHLEEYLKSPFHMGFVNRGYQVDFTEGSNKLGFPVTYYK